MGGAVFNNARALSNSEAAAMMTIVLSERKQADAAYTPNPVLLKTLEYAGTSLRVQHQARVAILEEKRRRVLCCAERLSVARSQAAAISMRQCAASALCSACRPQCTICKQQEC